MRTRNADTSKSPAMKKALPQKKAAASAADKTPETAAKSTAKNTPKATKVSKGKQSASKASTTPATSTPDPTPESKVEEIEILVEKKKPAPVGESPQQKPSAKKSLLSAKASTPKFEPEPLQEKEQEVKKQAVDTEEEVLEMKQETALDGMEEYTETNNANNEVEEVQESIDAKYKEEEEALLNNDTKNEVEEVPKTNKAESQKDLAMEEPMEETVPEEEGFVEPGDDELADANEIGGEGEVTGVEGHDPDQEGDGVEVEEQIEISDMAKARKIKKEDEIFVGGLDRDATEDDVRKEFEKVGEVVEVRILKDFATNKNKGFAFVKYAAKEQAAKALTELKNPTICGKRCGIAPSEDNDTLFLGNICNTWTKEAVSRKLKDYGIDTAVSITLVPDTQNEGVSRGFAFVEFPCHADAMVAYKRLQKPDVIFGHPERTAKVAFAVPLREPDPEVMAQVKSVFVDGLPPYWDEDRVKEQFKGYGVIERVVLARNMSSSKRNDFGFVNFTTHEAAIACIEGVNNTELGDGKSKTKARARLANPLPKTQAVKGGMSGGFRIGHLGIGGYPRVGRGFGSGRFPFHRAGFQGGRGFVSRGHGRGQFAFSTDDDFETSYSEFRSGWRPFGARARGRRISTSARRGGFDRGRGRVFASGSRPFPPEENFNGSFGARHLGDDPYFYDDGGQGMKRPLSMMEHDSYLDHGSRIRPRYDHPGPNAATGGTRYRDSVGMSGLYSHDYYGLDYGGRSYSSFYGGEPFGRGYHY